jgi:glycosyltransferase involved in cell wall biosynthesis
MSAPSMLEDTKNQGRADSGEPTPPSRVPLRVCFLLDRLLPAGTELQALSLIRHLDRAVVQPYLCLLDGEDPLSRSLEPEGCPVVRLGAYALRSPKALAAGFRFARFLRRERIDILQIYFTQSATFGAVVGRLAGVPRILRVRNNVGHWLNRKLSRRFSWINRLVDRIVTNSEAGRNAVIAQEGVSPSDVVVMRNGVDFHRFPANPTRKSLQQTGPKRVGAVANLRRVKGLDVLLEAASRVLSIDPDVDFVIAGSDRGEENVRWELEEQAKRLGISDRVVFLGSVPDVPAFLRSLDVAVLSSRAEGTSNALIEYMAAGLPIVATAVGGNVELIRDDIDGKLVPADDPDRLARALHQVLSAPDEAARLGEAAFHSVRRRFADESVGRNYEGLYRSLLIQEHSR